MNKSFINKQNGIKLNVISKFWGLLIGLSLALVLFGWPISGQAASTTKTYTQPFQNSTTTLSGNSVQTNMYFIKMDYWKIKKASLNLNFQVSQLASNQISDLTVSVNNVKFYSFRPKNKAGLQTKTIKIPIRLIQGENNLKISGQILNKAGNNYSLAQTPANWLTIYSGANVNFQYQLKAPEPSIKSFYSHFSGPDTIVYHNSFIKVPKQADNAELTASMYALSGEARIITTENQQIAVAPYDDSAANKADYQVIMGTYDHLPKRFQKLVSRSKLQQHAVLKTSYQGGKHYLVVTALTGDLLEKAARFMANQELMKETSSSTEYISDETNTYTSSLQYDGSYQLTKTADQLTGPKHQESTYFVSLPVDRTNADGSQIRIHFRYSKNLNFKRSLATVSVNGEAIGSQRLSSAKANDDTLTVTLPKGKALGNSFTIRVAFDLEMADQTSSDNQQTPWATIEPDSRAYIKSQPVNDLLFTNYPSIFLKNDTFNNIAVVRPTSLTGYDFQTLTNIFNLIGNFAESNTGKVEFYTKKPPVSVLREGSVIAFGTPDQNEFIKGLNKQLYFKYDKHYQGFVSNEKLSLEQAYGRTVGTDQLLRSPYNDKNGLLVVTAAHSADVYRASTQINFQRNIEQYTGDAIVVDRDNNHYNYHFKKHATIDQKASVKQQISKNSQLIIYLLVALFAIAIIGLAVFFILRKKGLFQRKEPDQHA